MRSPCSAMMGASAGQYVRPTPSAWNCSVLNGRCWCLGDVAAGVDGKVELVHEIDVASRIAGEATAAAQDTPQDLDGLIEAVAGGRKPHSDLIAHDSSS